MTRAEGVASARMPGACRPRQTCPQSGLFREAAKPPARFRRQTVTPMIYSLAMHGDQTMGEIVELHGQPAPTKDDSEFVTDLARFAEASCPKRPSTEIPVRGRGLGETRRR